LAWSAEGKLYLEAPDANLDTQIWISAADGSGRRQITTERLNGKPAPCGDGRHLVFLSFRGGLPHIWRSDPDGGNVVQLTDGPGEASPDCSPDGSWLTFAYGQWTVPAPPIQGVWRLPIDGGKPVRIWDRPGLSRISPDGKTVLVVDITGTAAIIPADGGQPRSLDHLIHLSRPADTVAWAPDGAALLYVKTIGGVSNVWRQPLDGGEAKPLTNFTSQRITWFDVSRDGKKLALARGSIAHDVVLIRDLK
jgi:Tol biopolymer transport system component